MNTEESSDYSNAITSTLKMNPKCRKSNYKHDNLNDQLLKVKHFRLPSLPGTVINKLTQKKTFGMS